MVVQDGGHGEPRVRQDVLQPDPLVGTESKARADQVLALVGQPRPELDLGVADLLVLLEGDVAAHHVVEQDPKAPDGGRVAVVAAVPDPLWGCVHSRS